MAIRGMEIGMRRQVARRVGGQGTIPRFRGAYRNGSPGDVPPDQFWDLRNVRFKPGGGIGARQPLQFFNRTAFDDGAAYINSLYDFQTGILRHLFMMVKGCVAVSPDVGNSIMWFDPDQDPALQRGVYYASSSNTPCFATFDGAFHIGIDSALARFTTINPPYGEEAIGGSGSSQNQPITSFSGFTIKAMMAFDAKLFIALDGGAGASKVVTWDGQSIRDDLTGIDPPKLFCLYRDTLVLAIPGASGVLKVRRPGSSPGTWTTVTPTTTPFLPEQAVSYKDLLGITGGPDGNIWSYDGTTLTVAHTIAGAITWGIESFNGYLYYSWEDQVTPLEAIGRYDSGVWTDTHKDLLAEADTIRQPTRLEKYRGDLYVSVTHDISASLGGEILSSPGADTAGTWKRIPLGSTAANGIENMVAF